MSILSAQETGNKDELIFDIDVPKDMKINDKIFLYNSSPYFFLNAVVTLQNWNSINNNKNVLDNNDESEKEIGSASYIYPGQKSEMASYDRNWLRRVRGQKITVKIKGIKNILTDVRRFDDTNDNARPDDSAISKQQVQQPADEIKLSDFNISISELHHDLYIKVTYNPL